MNATIEAGPELDGLIAERVMGFTLRTVAPSGVRWYTDKDNDYAIGTSPFVNTWRPSTLIAHAWLVVEKMREHPVARFRTLRMVAYSYNRTYATFDAYDDEGDWTEANGEHSTPLAICLAALKATEVG